MILLEMMLTQALASPEIGPTTFPVFSKMGFSSVLEFDEVPTQVVLGDRNLFQVEKLNKSLVIKPLAPYASTNMFVYFKDQPSRLFLITASEDADPLFYKKFQTTPAIPEQETKRVAEKPNGQSVILRKARFEGKNDFLTVDFVLAADSKAAILPNWDLIRLKFKERTIAPSKVWSQRREIQRDSQIRARLIFRKPNVPADLQQTSIIIPLKGSPRPLRMDLKVIP